MIKKAMKQTGLVYFSSLQPKRKDELVNSIVQMRLGIFDLPEQVKKVILFNIPVDQLLELKVEIERQLKGGKCFKINGAFYPINLKKIINSEKE